jgi:hypothetical protein
VAGVQGRTATPAPHADSVGSFQGRQGFATPSGVARVLGFACGPRQPPLRPLTPFPLQTTASCASGRRRKERRRVKGGRGSRSPTEGRDRVSTRRSEPLTRWSGTRSSGGVRGFKAEGRPLHPCHAASAGCGAAPRDVQVCAARSAILVPANEPACLVPVVQTGLPRGSRRPDHETRPRRGEGVQPEGASPVPWAGDAHVAGGRWGQSPHGTSEGHEA